MRKNIKKLLCVGLVTATAFGAAFGAGCDGTYNTKALEGGLGFTSSQEASSNGGFAVEKGDYVYFINGIEANTADNTYGEVEKGSLMRISKSDLGAKNYENVQTVVPSIIYASEYSAGIFIYGDRVYYTTPSTDRDGDGNVLNGYLNFNSTKLDGTGTSKTPIYQSSTSSIDYRYVEVDNTVYLMYIEAEAEGETTYKNIRSLNTETGDDTLLAYHVTNYLFSEDLENATVYYTMGVTNYVGSKNESAQNGYNQVYKVTADDTTANEYDFSYLEEDFDFEENPVYVNYGELVFDGIGNSDIITQFNQNFESGVTSGHEAYTYALVKYTEDGKLYYTRATSSGTVAMYAEEAVADSFKNPATNSAYCILKDSKRVNNLSSYEFVEVNGKTLVMFTESNCIMLGEMDGSKIVNEYPITKSASAAPEFLFTYEDTDNAHSYIYYSLTGGNGYSLYRVAYDGTVADYTMYPTTEDSTYKSVQVLDLDMNNAWYGAEIFDGQVMFASLIGDMSEYNYIQVCDLRNANGKMMSNAELEAYNEQYNGIADAIAEYDSTDYAYLQSALKFAFNLGTTDETKYLQELRQAYVDINGWNIEHTYTDETVEKYDEFISGTGDWAEYAKQTKTVNGKSVNSNMREYYYSVLGTMTEEDMEDYISTMKTTYFEAYPEEEPTWWESLETAQKAWFIIGVVAGSLLVIGAAIIIPMVIVNHKRNKRPVYRKVRKIDTDVDESVNVYEDEETAEKPTEETPEE